MDCDNSVIVDHVLFPEWLDQCVTLFENIPVLFVGVHCSLADLKERERRRGDRSIGQAEDQLPWVHKHADYDVEVDTSTQAVDACVNDILEALENDLESTAFERLRLKLGEPDTFAPG